MNISSSFRDLIVWQKSMALVHEIYTIVNQLPKLEDYILKSQMLRAVISIPSNIAEGWRRRHKIESKQFYNIALGSSAELETQILIIAQEYKTIRINTALILVDEVQKMLNSFANKQKS